MNLISQLFLHLDHTLPLVFSLYGNGVVAFLFVIIFCETGLVFLPFLPGDSLLFASGVLAAGSSLSVWVLWGVLAVAALLGDSLNYTLGRFFGLKLLTHTKWVKKSSLEKAKQYFDTKGKKAIILARFIPLFRTFVPFIAGISHMSYRRFSFYNMAGGIIWTGIFLLSGYFFADIPFVKAHFPIVILVIMGISMVPPALDFIKAWAQRKKS